MSVDPTIIAWAAGLFDGEGCISLGRRQAQNGKLSYSYRLILKVTMCDRRTVHMLHKIFGVGSLHEQKRQYDHHTRPWIWFCNAQAARTVLLTMRPYLVTKAAEADVALRFLEMELAPLGGSKGTQKVPARLEAKRAAFHKKLRDMKGRNKAADLKSQRKVVRYA